MIIQDTQGLGRAEVTYIPMPDYAKNSAATYTYSGKVLDFYRTDDDPEEKDHWNIAVANDGGSGFRMIYSSVSIPYEKCHVLDSNHQLDYYSYCLVPLVM